MPAFGVQASYTLPNCNLQYCKPTIAYLARSFTALHENTDALSTMSWRSSLRICHRLRHALAKARNLLAVRQNLRIGLAHALAFHLAVGVGAYLDEAARRSMTTSRPGRESSGWMCYG